MQILKFGSYFKNITNFSPQLIHYKTVIQKRCANVTRRMFENGFTFWNKFMFACNVIANTSVNTIRTSHSHHTISYNPYKTLSTSDKVLNHTCLVTHHQSFCHSVLIMNCLSTRPQSRLSLSTWSVP